MPDDFDARSADELTLRRGDRIELVELDDGFGDGWYLGKHLGHEGNGLFPGGRYPTAGFGYSLLQRAKAKFLSQSTLPSWVAVLRK